jgi:hypothetical protein
MFESKAAAYMSGAPFTCSPQGWALDPTCKHWARLERPTSDKRSSIFGLFASYKEKRFINLASEGLCNKKSLMILKRVVNFTNILHLAFSYKSFLHSFYVLTIWVYNFLSKGF